MTDPHTTLVRSLQSAGLLDDPAWREAFMTIPRYHFLPCFYGASGDTWRRFDSRSVGDNERYRLACSDQTWVVRLSGPHSQPGQPASSSLQPSIVARMIHALSVAKSDDILEIGTGTGYLTALLCHRLGASNITSIDIDPELVDSAGRILAELGFTPTLATADGIHGYPDCAPYDRVLGTAAVARVPQSWIDQTRPGGRIVTPLRSAIAVIDVHDDRHATGQFLPLVTRVLPLRTGMPAPSAHSPLSRTIYDTSVQQSSIPVRALYDENFRFLLDLTLPGIEYHDQGPLGGLIMRHPDGSTAQINPTGQTQQHGSRRLYDDIAAIYDIWRNAGDPHPGRYRLTINPQGHMVSLDDRRSSHSWEL